ncbi:hypothetical protein Btru_007917 [Bulinus truncatus]|nr:hypothetical protein Btru_007917 [Bulinus truncatus]
MQKKQSDLSSASSRVESKKDKACHMSKRRPQSYDLDYRSSASFTSFSQSQTYPHNLNGPHHPQFSPWYSRPKYHSLQNGSRHLYPGQQNFMQHRPFGSENNYFRPLRYPNHFSLPHPHFLDHPTHPYIEARRNNFRYQADNGHFDEMLNAQSSRSFKNECGQGARPKSGPCPNGKKKCFKKKKSQNNSSNATLIVDDESQKDSIESSGGSQTTGIDVGTSLIKSNTLKNVFQNCKSDDLHCPSNTSVKVNPSESLDVDCSLGAVGGESSNLLKKAVDARCTSVLSFDKNLIDEGAICDLDKMFQRQEFSCFTGNSRDMYHSDEELDKEAKATNSYQDTSDDDSEFENCSYVYDPKHCHSLDNTHSLPHNKSGMTSSTNTDAKQSHINGAAGVMSNSEAPEDTGDFIDTDLPAQKHLLSSSDEMDSHSSSSDSDRESEEGKTCRSHKLLQDFNSNDLSSCECELPRKVELLSIGKELIGCGSHTSSHFEKSKDKYNDKVPFQARSQKSSTDSYSSSSENENDEGSTPNSPSKNYVHNSAPQGFYDSAVSCIDGAAASQLPLERSLTMAETSYNSCPPGAECEMAPLTTPQCFHSNLFCSGARVCGQNKSGKSSDGEHVAFTASSGTDHSRGVHMTSESAGCSATADGGACCSLSVGYLLPGVNDLNACCHHNHSHVANGFNDGDTPGANFSNDESNRLQKVFVKFSNEDKLDEGESHSASSCDLEEAEGRKTEKNSDSGGTEDPLSHDNSDNVDMVLLPMEEEIEPVHHMSGGLCAGGVDDDDDLYHDISGQLATSGKLGGGSMGYMFDDHDQNPLGNGMPSKEFYELIKTVSTTDSYMRFFDKDGQDVQRQPLVPCDDESKQSSTPGGPNSKTERLKVDRVMIWNEYEAYVMQFKQIAVSACGQTAVLNVLKALKISCEKSAVCKVIQTSLRKEDACVPEYLFSRAKAGTTAEELMRGVEKLSNGAVGGRFFHFWPPRKIKLLQWLAYWMKRGAIPMATLNLQQGPHSLWQVPDSWHHQMVYGVSHQGLYLTNPLEIVSERSAMKQLSSDSVLMVRRQDIISRIRETTDLGQLLNHPDQRWRTMNVLGQVVNVLREFNMPSVPGYRLQVTSHVSIPASYKAGITLFMRKDKSAWTELLSAPEIPLE